MGGISSKSKCNVFHNTIIRSSRPEVLYEGVPKNFEKVTGRHLRHSHFLGKVAGRRLATLLKKDSDTGAFQ